MDLILGEEGLKLVKLYQETLQISYDEAVNILSKNKTAEMFLKEELALAHTEVKKNLNALLSITLLRNYYDFEPLRNNERELLDKYYEDKY